MLRFEVKIYDNNAFNAMVLDTLSSAIDHFGAVEDACTYMPNGDFTVYVKAENSRLVFKFDILKV